MRIYLDHNATTPVRDAVADAVVYALRDVPGNPSSPHSDGAAARALREQAREEVAALIGAAPDEILFTSGASEANNTALSVADEPGAVVVSTRVEHPSVEEPLCRLERRGVTVHRLPVDRDGLLAFDRFADALSLEPRLVSVIWANNETGVVQAIETLGESLRRTDALLHLDGTQALGKLRVGVATLGVDLLSGSAHKFGGPKGVGFLYRRRGIELDPIVLGGPQESRQRGGTENLPGIAGLGAAARIAREELDAHGPRMAELRDRLRDGIFGKVPRVRENGSREHRLPNTLNLEFCGAAGDVLVEALDLEGIAVSSGAACASGSVEPSPVLTAMGRSADEARGSLRFSLGHGNDESQIDRVLQLLPDLVSRVREAHAP